MSRVFVPDPNEPPYRFTQGSVPLLLSLPHAGTHIPDALRARLTPAALRRADTDWHLERLYGVARELGASVLVATHSRYVIDVNRPADDSSLYPGRSVTGLCPVDTFDEEPLYLDPADTPDDADRQARLAAIWQPYHERLATELQRLRQVHGVAMLWDGHSIRSHVPRFFDGELAALNLGTADGTSCDATLAAALIDVARQQDRYRCVLDGRFKGGYITRHYGRPADRVHAVQLEMTHATYMDEAYPFGYRDDLAQQVQPLLGRFLQTMLHHAGTLANAPDGREPMA